MVTELGHMTKTAIFGEFLPLALFFLILQTTSKVQMLKPYPINGSFGDMNVGGPATKLLVQRGQVTNNTEWFTQASLCHTVTAGQAQNQC